MREILFRGKRLYNGDWVYGNLVIDKNDKPHIVPKDYFYEDGHHLKYYDDTDKPVFIDPVTVGQYTGLTDKNGTKIFEGDIVNYPDTYLSWSGDVDVKGNVGAVEWSKITMCFYFSNRIAVDMEEFFVLNGCMTDVEVIGNIHDNPELIGG